MLCTFIILLLQSVYIKLSQDIAHLRHPGFHFVVWGGHTGCNGGGAQ